MQLNIVVRRKGSGFGNGMTKFRLFFACFAARLGSLERRGGGVELIYLLRFGLGLDWLFGGRLGGKTGREESEGGVG